MKIEKNSMRLKQYFSDEMSDQEKEDLFRDMKKDSNLEKEYNLWLQVRKNIIGKLDIDEVLEEGLMEEALQDHAAQTDTGLSKSERADLLGFIRESMEDQGTPRKESKKSDGSDFRRQTIVLSSILAAASIVLLFIIFTPEPGSISSRLYLAYYEKFEPISYNYRGIDAGNNYFQEGIEAFSEGRIRSAIELFEKVDSSDYYFEEKKFYFPLSLMETGNIDQAKELLEEYLLNYSTYHIEAKWYLSLCLIENNEFQDARRLLKEIGSTSSIYQRPAQDLLKRLRRGSR